MGPAHLELRFVTSNPHKVTEAQEILKKHGIRVVAFDSKIEELQTTDTVKLIHHKLLQAFSEIGRPLFVEHTGLYLEHLEGLPGGLTQIFWDKLQADRFAELFGKSTSNPKAIARTWISYCDGKKMHDYEGEVAGQIVPEPRGPRDFQWDCVFQPDGYAKTFAEMGPQKNDISMRRAALDKLAGYLCKELRR